MDNLVVGKVVKPHGVKGSLKVIPVIDDGINFSDLNGVFVDFNDDFYEFEDVFAVSDMVGLKLKDVNTIDDANKFVGKFLYVKKEVMDKLIDNNSFYIEELKGSKVYLGNEFIGLLDEIDNFGSADVFYIKSQKYKNLSLPHVQGLVDLFNESNKELYLNKDKFLEVAVYDNWYSYIVSRNVWTIKD